MSLIFLILAGVAIVGASGLILFRNPVYSALGLLLTFFAMSGIYILLEAPVLAVFQVAVYAGAVMVLFVFVVMFLNLDDEFGFEPVEIRRIAMVVAGAGVGVALLLFALSLEGSVTGHALPPKQAQWIAESLLKRHVVAFEIISLLLVGAAIGAMALNKGKSQ